MAGVEGLRFGVLALGLGSTKEISDLGSGFRFGGALAEGVSSLNFD